jgi:hypothetical protein
MSDTFNEFLPKVAHLTSFSIKRQQINYQSSKKETNKHSYNTQLMPEKLWTKKKNSHVIALHDWTELFSPYLHAAPQGRRKKHGRFRVIVDPSTQTTPDEAVLNHITNTGLKAVIDFGQAKKNLFINIYSWWVSFSNKIIYLILADITTSFWFPQVLADITSAFSFLADGLYFLWTGHVFGSNTSASFQETIRRAIQSIIPVYSNQADLVAKHKDLLDQTK